MVAVLVGASHHEVPLDAIEQLARSGDGLARRLIEATPDVRGAVVVSTCNRFEIYLDLIHFHDALDTAMAAVADLAGVAPDFVADTVRVSVGTAVAQHLFSVASGLESMVVGEDEVAGQVRTALGDAQVQETTSPMLERLMQRALSTSKAVANSTGLGAAGRSIVTVGLDIVEGRHGSVAGKRALIIGTGSYARVVIAALRRRGCDDIAVYSSSGRAERFAESHDIRAVGPDDLRSAICATDIIIASSGAPHPLIEARHLSCESGASPAPRAGVLPIIDLALAPDVAPEVRERDDVDLIDLDVIAEHAPQEHTSQIVHAQEIVRDAVEAFERAESGRGADPAVVAMRGYFHAVVDEEVERVRRRRGDEAAQELARSLYRVSNALLHTPSIRAHELARSGDLADYRKAMHVLFGIEVEAERPAAALAQEPAAKLAQEPAAKLAQEHAAAFEPLT